MCLNLLVEPVTITAVAVTVTVTVAVGGNDRCALNILHYPSRLQL